MSTQGEVQQSRVPRLTQYCYRFINSHLDAIVSLGHAPYRLCEPVLRSCSAEQLLALEKNSPHLANEDQDVWRCLCFRDFPRSEGQYEQGEFLEPESWRDQYVVCRESEEKRVEDAGYRVRSKREDLEGEKKERQVVFTDRVPPSKRTRFNNTAPKPKTLFEKTRAESIKIQRLVYGPAMLPPMPPMAARPRPLPLSKPVQPPIKTATPRAAHLSGKSLAPDRSPKSNLSPSSTSLSPAKSPGSPALGSQRSRKKDPMATLFMPKHRAHSQLSTEPLRRK